MSKRRFLSNDPIRRQWQNPEAILSDAGLVSGMTFIDIGCGEGFFSIPAAHIVGPRGQVHAFDINEEAIHQLAIQSKEEQLDQLFPEIGTGEDTVLCEGGADMVFFGIDLHDFEDPGKVLKNAKTMLNLTGVLVDLDWKDQPMEFGPPPEKRFSKEKAIGLIESVGFQIVSAADAGPYHYCIIAKL
ncbi:MAG: methyltransferase domain-containing protein [Methanomicrobiales archaeon]|nr:methyltransferase domain-containing protein [Methanomicrobiales archaeon]